MTPKTALLAGFSACILLSFGDPAPSAQSPQERRASATDWEVSVPFEDSWVHEEPLDPQTPHELPEVCEKEIFMPEIRYPGIATFGVSNIAEGEQTWPMDRRVFGLKGDPSTDKKEPVWTSHYRSASVMPQQC